MKWNYIYIYIYNHAYTVMITVFIINPLSLGESVPQNAAQSALVPGLKEKAQRLGSVVCLLGTAEVVRSPAN